MRELASALVLGMGYGFTTCSLSCLPTLAPYMLSFGGGLRDGARSSLLFAFGKTTAYSILGALAALAGQSLLPEDGNAGRWSHGSVLIITGLALPLISSNRCTNKARAATTALSLFAAGFSSSLAPCLPVAGLVAVAAGVGSVLRGAGLGLAFGMGVTLFPILIGGGLLALIAKTVHEETQRYLKFIRWIAALVLILMGIRIIW